MTYALGRGLTAYDMPVVRGILREARGRRLPVPVDRYGHRRERAVSDASEGRPAVARTPRATGRREPVMFITRRSLVATNRASRARHRRRAAVPRVDGAGDDGARADAARPPLRFGAVYVPNGCPIRDTGCRRATPARSRSRRSCSRSSRSAASMTVISNLSRAGGTGVTDHAVSSAGWLSGRRREADRSRGHPRRHHDRSGAREAASARRRRSRRSSSRPRTSPATSAAACPATAART